MRGILVLLMVATPAFADTLAPAKTDDTATAPAKTDDTAPRPTTELPPATFHKGRIGFSARLSVGAQAIATYDNKYYCGTADATADHGNAPVCAGRSPFALGLEASYGVARHVELVLELRLGLEKDFGGAPNLEGPH